MDMLQGMRAVVEVSRVGSFAGAARAMNISAPSVTRIVNDLEADLKVRLFNRSTRHVALTAEGQEFLRHAKVVLEEIDLIRAEAADQRKEPHGQLEISSSLAFGNEVLSPILPEFQKRHPNIDIHLEISNRTVDLIEDSVDIALRVGVGGLPDSSLISVPVFSYNLIFVASPKHLKAYGAPKSLDDLQNRPMVKLSTGRWGHVQTLTTPKGKVDFPVPGALEVNSYRAQLHAVLNGDACALMHDVVANPYLKDGSLVHVLRDYATINQEIYAVFAHRTLIASRIRVFIDFLKERLGESHR